MMKITFFLNLHYFLKALQAFIKPVDFFSISNWGIDLDYYNKCNKFSKNPFLKLKNICILYWSIVDQQCCNDFRCTERCTHPHVCAKSLQSCPALCASMELSLPSSSVHGDFPVKITRVGCCDLLQGIFPIQRYESLMSPALSVGFFATSPTWESYTHTHT